MLLGTVLTWYRHDVCFSLELIESFVADIEKQAAESIADYERGKQEEVLSDVVGEGEEDFARVVESYGGLNSESWNLPGIFKEYFPNLQRSSALLTVYGYFEHELDKLCLLYQSEKRFKLTVSDLSGKGIDRSTNYLEKVARLDTHKTSAEWTRITKIRKIRNSIVHDGGRLRNRQGRPIKGTTEAMQGMKFLSGDDEIVLETGFLSSVVGTFADYFGLIGASIEKNEKQ